MYIAAEGAESDNGLESRQGAACGLEVTEAENLLVSAHQDSKARPFTGRRCDC